MKLMYKEPQTEVTKVHSIMNLCDGSGQETVEVNNTELNDTKVF